MKHSLNLGVGEVRRGEATSYSVAEAGAAGSASSVAVAVAPVWTVAGISLGLTLLTLLALFWDTANSAVQTWLGDRTYGHGFLIVPIVGYLIWRRRSELLRLAPAPWPWGLAAMAMAVLLWLIGYISSVQVLQQLAFIAMVQSAVITVLGPRGVRRPAVPDVYAGLRRTVRKLPDRAVADPHRDDGRPAGPAVWRAGFLSRDYICSSPKGYSKSPRRVPASAS